MTRFERCMEEVERLARQVNADNDGDEAELFRYRYAAATNLISDMFRDIERHHPDSEILKKIDAWHDYLDSRGRRHDLAA